ncbi:unnamed protein product [Danaus chrysippus]|uniref:(African queen) hypothetical protein n=1 Tax=Danaus chrysippus TaxID=151541 RepID=A0A8J2QWK9_9NEOP|nr:unnamed protein product [Danaus chrysippus]
MNPAHFREFSHPHLESILDNYSGSGGYDIPERFSLQQNMIREQLDMMIENKLYEGQQGDRMSKDNEDSKKDRSDTKTDTAGTSRSSDEKKNTTNKQTTDEQMLSRTHRQTDTRGNNMCGDKKLLDSTYRPMVPPTRDPRSFLDVVVTPGGMLSKHAAAAPYYVFYTTIKDSKNTHEQKYSITLLEILDSSLGELKCSLQINFMVDAGWLLAHYYFAGYSAKKLTILYGEESDDLKNVSRKKQNVETHHVKMSTPFGKHHTKMMLLCYEDGSLRVVVSTANLYLDDWQNRTQGLWLSPRCPPLPAESPSLSGESPTGFKRSLLDYLQHYRLPQLAYYVHRVQRCDFTNINVFLVCSVPGTHYSPSFGFPRVGALLRAHCELPPHEARSWPLIAQASSLGSYGKEPASWLTGDFLHHFTKIKDQPQTLTPPPELKLIYPSLENVKSSHDGLLGGGCLPYSATVHTKQPWLNNFLYQWRARHSARDRAMPHIKSYLRVSPDCSRASYYLLTSGNVSKAAWGSRNKDGGVRIMSYEAGVLLLPRFMINSPSFPLSPSSPQQLLVPYDLPPHKYTPDMSPWLLYICCAVVAAARAEDSFYAPQTFKQVGYHNKGPFTPAEDVLPQGSSQGSQWKTQPYDDYGREQAGQEDWRVPYGNNKERQATILHHKQSLSSEGAFRFEYASDTGLEAGEVISPDGSRVGAYQYKDPAGQLVKLKYRAGKEGFQILEGSHVPKSPEPVAPPTQGSYYQEPYQQHYQQEQTPDWRQVPQIPQAPQVPQAPVPPPQYYNQNWKTDGRSDGHYNELEEQSRGPHSFGTGYAFAFKG